MGYSMSDIASLLKDLGRKRQEALDRIRTIPVAALVWGPNPGGTDPLGSVRLKLRETLRKNGHIAEFSEDLYDSSITLSNFVQQLAQAEAFDLIFSMPNSHGAIGEVHDFARLPQVSRKLIAYVDERHSNGYSASSLISAQSVSTCKIELYDGSKLPGCIIDSALDQVRRLQEFLYVSGAR